LLFSLSHDDYMRQKGGGGKLVGCRESMWILLLIFPVPCWLLSFERFERVSRH
jgi:hypothetical protein